MQAVIRTGGKQYYVRAGDILEVEKLDGGIGEQITLSDVLLVANNGEVKVGQPTVAGATVTATITGQYRGNKIQVFRYRPKKRIRVRRGHRQHLTRLAIAAMQCGDWSEAVGAAQTKPVATIVEETPVEEAPVASETPIVAASETPIVETTEVEAAVETSTAESTDNSADKKEE